MVKKLKIQELTKKIFLLKTFFTVLDKPAVIPKVLKILNVFSDTIDMNIVKCFHVFELDLFVIFLTARKDWAMQFLRSNKEFLWRAYLWSDVPFRGNTNSFLRERFAFYGDIFLVGAAGYCNVFVTSNNRSLCVAIFKRVYYHVNNLVFEDMILSTSLANTLDLHRSEVDAWNDSYCSS